MQVSQPVLVIVISSLLGLVFGWVMRAAFKPVLGAPSFFNMNTDDRLWILSIFLIVIGLASCLGNILLVVYYKITDPVILTLIGNFNGAVMSSTVILVPNYWLGSSNGSRMKDIAKAAEAPAPVAKVEQ